MYKTIDDAREALYRFYHGKQTLCDQSSVDDDNLLISKALDEYKRLLDIMDRAKKVAFQVLEEEDQTRVRFKMDANGNLTRIEDNEI